MNAHVEAEIAEINNGWVARCQPGSSKLTHFPTREQAVSWVTTEVIKALNGTEAKEDFPVLGGAQD